MSRIKSKFNCFTCQYLVFISLLIFLYIQFLSLSSVNVISDLLHCSLFFVAVCAVVIMQISIIKGLLFVVDPTNPVDNECIDITQN